MKRITLLFSLAFLFTNYSFSQDKVQISGQVKNSETKEKIEFCNASVFNAKDSLISVAATNLNGFFNLSLDQGYYKIIMSMVGFKTDTTKLFAATADKFLGVFLLKPSVINLKEVQVKESSRETKLDRDVQIVTEKMKAGTSSAKDVLEKVAGVSIDRYSNTIKVDNSAKVIILVDGIEKDQEYIKNLAPDRLKKVEVIHDPGGRYALEGYSAVINIILKKDYKGTDIFLDDNLIVDPDASKSSYIPIGNNFSATLNFVYNKVNVYLKYNNNTDKFNFNTFSSKKYSSGLQIEQSPLTNSDVNTKVSQQYNNYTFGTDFYINPKHTLSFESSLSTQPKGENTSSEIYNVISSLNNATLANDTSQTSNSSNNTSSYNSLFYEGNIDGRNVINSNFTYSNYYNTNTTIFKQGSFARNEAGKDIQNGTNFYLEFTHTFDNKSSLNVGYGNTWKELNSSFVADSSSQFTYSDLRNKLYAYYAFPISKKLSMKLGAAGETSAPNADGRKASYLIFQPYADVKFDASANLILKAKYRSSSNYPEISQTNPYSVLVDLQSVRTGNPNLKPEVVNKISLQATILQGLLSIEPYYHFSNNYITEVGSSPTDSTFQYSYSNAGKYRNYGVEASLTVPIAKNFFIQSNANVYFASIKYAAKTNNVNDFSMNAQLIYQNLKSKTMAGMQYQKSNQKNITAQGYNNGNNDFWILFVRQPFLKEKLTVQLVYITPISWGVNYKQGYYIKTDYYTESKFNNIDILKNIVLLQVSYRFNKGKSVNIKEKEIEKIKEKGNKSLF
ncbi:MAG: TonB-dependent receptor [Bacteroidota bacterium]